MSNVASVASSSTNGVNLGHGYDTLNRLSTVTDSNLVLGSDHLHHDDVSNMAAVTYPKAVVHTYGHDPKSRLTSLMVNRGETSLGITYIPTASPARADDSLFYA